ncbi:alpha/beta hydrolase [Kitasatospora azatica]|uniref:alpha/beta hydrolase n=1 Tax=Kitasatospora azatica TaxID=58347 RepID=UPI000691FF65|nr:alpha/beta hydrolase [Kitasatospora azatica]
MELAALRDARLNALPDCAEAYEQLAGAFRDHAEEWQSAVAGRTRNSGWLGAAADTCRASLQRTDGQLASARAELLLIAAALRSGSEAVQLAHARLADALEEAATAGLTVDEYGHIAAPPRAAADRHDPDARNCPDQGQDLALRISAALREADAADRALADQLTGFARAAADGTGLDYRGFAPDPLSPAITAPDLLAAALPPANATPTAVAAWWRSLPPDEQRHLLATRPDLLGNRDGLPAEIRDQANRLNLQHYLADYGTRTGLSPADQTKLAGFRAIQDRLDHSADTPPVLLYGISDEGQGHGILSFGNPDTAVNVSAYVPGLGTELRHVGGKDGERALSVWAAAHSADPNRATASMVWLGYDPPPGLDRLDLQTLTVMDKARAEKGAKAYDQFLAGLRASHNGPPAHLTALGHSYGSLTVGLAGRRPEGTGADEMVLIGSPGTGARSASQLGVGADRVWVGAADHDPVSYAPNPLEELTGDFNQRWFGTDPAAAEFGAHRFDVADGPSRSFESHSNYLDPRGGNSLFNIGQIVSGHSDKAKLQSPR